MKLRVFSLSFLLFSFHQTALADTCLTTGFCEFSKALERAAHLSDANALAVRPMDKEELITAAKIIQASSERDYLLGLCSNRLDLFRGAKKKAEKACSKLERSYRKLKTVRKKTPSKAAKRIITQNRRFSKGVLLNTKSDADLLCTAERDAYTYVLECDSGWPFRLHDEEENSIQVNFETIPAVHFESRNLGRGLRAEGLPGSVCLSPPNYEPTWPFPLTSGEQLQELADGLLDCPPNIPMLCPPGYPCPDIDLPDILGGLIQPIDIPGSGGGGVFSIPPELINLDEKKDDDTDNSENKELEPTPTPTPKISPTPTPTEEVSETQTPTATATPTATVTWAPTTFPTTIGSGSEITVEHTETILDVWFGS